MEKPRKLQRIHRWVPGQDPNDPDEPGWERVKLDIVTPAGPPKLPDTMSGPDSGVTCFRCKHDTYRIVDHKDIDLVTGYSIKREEFHDTKLLLVCSNCGDKVQMYRSALDQTRHNLEAKHE